MHFSIYKMFCFTSGVYLSGTLIWLSVILKFFESDFHLRRHHEGVQAVYDLTHPAWLPSLRWFLNKDFPLEGFPGGSVVKNLPVSAGDTGSIWSHMPRSSQSCAPQLLSLCSRTQKPQLLSPCAAKATKAHTWEPMLHNKRSLYSGKPTHRN